MKLDRESLSLLKQIERKIAEHRGEVLELLRQAVIRGGGKVYLAPDKIRVRGQGNFTVQDVEVVEGNLRIVSVTGTDIAGNDLNDLYAEDLITLFKQCIV